MNHEGVLDFYKTPTQLTAPGRFASRFDELPEDVARLCGIVPGLLIYEYVAARFYGIELSAERKKETHLRRVEQMLARIFELDGAPLFAARPLEKRLVGVCHHFMLLLVAMLRSKNIPARARCGFGSYFNAPYFEDHWVCEYWSETERRWAAVDPQMDEVWRKKLKIDFNPLDVPRDRFIVAADAWRKCRAGEADPAKFGIFKGDLRGLWFIAGNLVRDLAALNKSEMLPFDVWGAQPKPDAQLSSEQLAFFDRLAALTVSPDSDFDELRTLYEENENLRVPETVFNAVLQKSQAV